MTTRSNRRCSFPSTDRPTRARAPASPRGEEGRHVPAHAPGGELHALVGDQLRPAHRAVELELIEPSVEAALVEHVSARQPPHAVPLPEPAQAHHTALRAGAAADAAAFLDGEPVGEEPVEVELLGEDDQAGEAGAERGGEEAGVAVAAVVVGGGGVEVEVGGVEGAGEAEGVEEAGEGGAESIREREREGKSECDGMGSLVLWRREREREKGRGRLFGVFAACDDIVACARGSAIGSLLVCWAFLSSNSGGPLSPRGHFFYAFPHDFHTKYKHD
ncbi:hypothetical protein EUGRSUZ_G02229 [Eucalyptus grandis]|uniref:Uncharacterized protein n=2 Tax=Eucalyptus grandis TaxID=71139 RepID=A0ACC3K6H8_EUCGR|nr:hypothetical protein EUGRSUZ_G02229 [Eucalyptus grandis]